MRYLPAILLLSLGLALAAYSSDARRFYESQVKKSIHANQLEWKRNTSKIPRNDTAQIRSWIEAHFPASLQNAVEKAYFAGQSIHSEETLSPNEVKWMSRLTKVSSSYQNEETKDLFKTHLTPIMPRGTLDSNHVQTLVFGMESHSPWNSVGSAMTGESGAYLQDILHSLGIRKNYLIITPFAYSLWTDAFVLAPFIDHSKISHESFVPHPIFDALFSDKSAIASSQYRLLEEAIGEQSESLSLIIVVGRVGMLSFAKYLESKGAECERNSKQLNALAFQSGAQENADQSNLAGFTYLDGEIDPHQFGLDPMKCHHEDKLSKLLGIAKTVKLVSLPDFDRTPESSATQLMVEQRLMQLVEWEIADPSWNIPSDSKLPSEFLHQTAPFTKSDFHFFPLDR